MSVNRTTEDQYLNPQFISENKHIVAIYMRLVRNAEDINKKHREQLSHCTNKADRRYLRNECSDNDAIISVTWGAIVDMVDGFRNGNQYVFDIDHIRERQNISLSDASDAQLIADIGQWLIDECGCNYEIMGLLIGLNDPELAVRFQLRWM